MPPRNRGPDSGTHAIGSGAGGAVSEEVPAAPGGFGPGSRIAGYLLEEEIGRGGMAVVFRAHDERLDRLVALKILAPGLALDDAFRQRFMGESRAAAAVDDPHIIPVFEAGEAGGVLYIAMRFVRGGDVRTLLDQDGPLSPARATEIIFQVASALDAAHARGLVHRDVKPANMLVDTGRDPDRPVHVYLSDFGLSKQSLAPTGLTATGQFLGTLEYIAPEQIEGRPVDGRADQYALACAAFELLSGAPPFSRNEGLAVIYAQLSEPPPPLTGRRAGLPAAIDQVMARAMAKSPAERYLSCRDFAVAMRDAFGLRPARTGPAARPAPERPPTEIAMPVAGATAAAEQPSDDSPPPRDAQPSPDSPSQQPPPGSAGPQTEAAGLPTPRSTKTGITDPAGGQAAATGGYAQPAPRWRSRGALAAACVALLVGGGGAVALLHHPGNSVGAHAVGGPGGGQGHSSAAAVTAVAPPGCTTTTAKARFLSNVSRAVVPLAGEPFGSIATSDGRYTFVSLGNSVAVLRNGNGLAPTLIRTIPAAGAKSGEAITANGKYLLVADRSGAVVISVQAAEQGDAHPVVGVLSSHGSGADQIAISPDSRFAFITLETSNDVGVFNLQEALAHGFGSAYFVGNVPLHKPTFGIAASPDGNWLYVTSIRVTSDVNNPGQGTLSMLSLRGAEAKPRTAIRASANAGCSPVRVITSADGKVLWVAARQSNSVLAFSAAKLRSDPTGSLLAKVAVGVNPVGMALVDGGSRLVVADSNINLVKGAAPNLAVLSTKKALAGQPALLGLLKSGVLPRQVLLLPGGRTLLVTVTTSHQLRAFNVADLP
jgi:serine/threonine protein kinase/DNA-binding beta-propeller fold protein YncE